MDESAQQAVQLSVNITIFVIALSISINLLIGVRDVATAASEYNASIPAGSRVLTVESQKKRVISGYELLSYYANYMNEVNEDRTSNFVITIEDIGTLSSTPSEDDKFDIKDDGDIKSYFERMNIGLDKKYEVITQKYDEENNILELTLRVIEAS